MLLLRTTFKDTKVHLAWVAPAFSQLFAFTVYQVKNP